LTCRPGTVTQPDGKHYFTARLPNNQSTFDLEKSEVRQFLCGFTAGPYIANFSTSDTRLFLRHSGSFE
jgi:hypothetical protein